MVFTGAVPSPDPWLLKGRVAIERALASLDIEGAPTKRSLRIRTAQSRDTPFYALDSLLRTLRQLLLQTSGKELVLLSTNKKHYEPGKRRKNEGQLHGNPIAI